MPSHQHPDGRWVHTFSASWLREYATCPERARRRYFGITKRSASEYTALGSAFHAGVEFAIRSKMGEEQAEVNATDAALLTLEGIEAQADFLEGGKIGPEDRRRLLAQHLNTFTEKVLPELQPVAVEHEFDVPVHVDPFREVRLRGRIDYIDAQLGVIDWKTAGSPHKTWEAERWDVQSTVYTLAEKARTGTAPDGLRYVVFVHDKALQTYTIERNEQHMEWVRLQAVQAARMVESGLPHWVMNDAGWWCAEKWCPAWQDCKGAVLGSEKEK